MDNLNSFETLNKKDRQDFYIALAVIISVLSFIMYFSFSSFFTDTEALFIKGTADEIQLDDAIILEGEEYVPLVQGGSSLEAIKSNSDQNLLVIVEVDSSISNSSSLVEVDSMEIMKMEVEKGTMKDTTILYSNVLSSSKMDSIEYNSAMEDIVEEEVLESDTVVAELPQVKETIKEIEVDKSCVIAVGLYRNENNANRMKNRLDAGGFNSFISSRSGKYQVMVYHSCDTASLNNSLGAIRKSYASDAIVLVKK